MLASAEVPNSNLASSTMADDLYTPVDVPASANSAGDTEPLSAQFSAAAETSTHKSRISKTQLSGGYRFTIGTKAQDLQTKYQDLYSAAYSRGLHSRVDEEMSKLTALGDRWAEIERNIKKRGFHMYTSEAVSQQSEILRELTRSYEEVEQEALSGIIEGVESKVGANEA